MGQYCENCNKFMINSELTHCSDECLLSLVQGTTSVIEDGINAVSWDDRSDPWT